MESRSTSPPPDALLSSALDDDENALVFEADDAAPANMGRILDGMAVVDDGPAVKAARSMKLAAAAGVRASGLIVDVLVGIRSSPVSCPIQVGICNRWSKCKFHPPRIAARSNHSACFVSVANFLCFSDNSYISTILRYL